MIYQISNLLLQAIVTIVGGACLIRCYSQYFRINLAHAAGFQISGYLQTLSNWIILPLRKVLPSVGRLDLASLLAAYLITLVKTGILWFISGAPISIAAILLLSVFELINLFLSGIIGAVFLSVILSWFAAGSMFAYFINALTEPFLNPIRNAIPRLGMIDLSPIVLFFAVQIFQIVLANLELIALPIVLRW
jgi:YggT family protein